MNEEVRKLQDMKKITTIIMNKKMSVVTTLSDYTTMSHLCIAPWADSCLEQPCLHAILEQNIKIHNSHYCCAHTLHTPLHSHACTHLSSYTHVAHIH